jgi:hypothetical protein
MHHAGRGTRRSAQVRGPPGQCRSCHRPSAGQVDRVRRTNRAADGARRCLDGRGLGEHLAGGIGVCRAVFPDVTVAAVEAAKGPDAREVRVAAISHGAASAELREATGVDGGVVRVGGVAALACAAGVGLLIAWGLQCEAGRAADTADACVGAGRAGRARRAASAAARVCLAAVGNAAALGAASLSAGRGVATRVRAALPLAAAVGAGRLAAAETGRARFAAEFHAAALALLAGPGAVVRVLRAAVYPPGAIAAGPFRPGTVAAGSGGCAEREHGGDGRDSVMALPPLSVVRGESGLERR